MSTIGATRPHPIPALARQGVISTGSDGGQVAAARKRLAPVNLAPTLRPEPAYFHRVPVNAPVIPAGLAAVYGIRRVRPSANMLGIALLHISAELLPSDSTAAGPGGGVGDMIAWGDAKGITAKIIVGKSLAFMDEGAWTAAPLDLPGIDLANAGADPRTWIPPIPRPQQYFAVFGFPGGSFGDADILRDIRDKPLAASASRISQGETLDVALVVKGDQITGQTGALYGDVYVNLICADIAQERSIQS